MDSPNFGYLDSKESAAVQDCPPRTTENDDNIIGMRSDPLPICDVYTIEADEEFCSYPRAITDEASSTDCSSNEKNSANEHDSSNEDEDIQSEDQFQYLSDLELAIQNLFQELNALHEDCLSSVNHDDDIFHDQVHTRKILTDADKYYAGALLCKQYIFGNIRVDEFCNAMVEHGLRSHLLDICQFIPEDLVSEYTLHETE